MCSDACGEHLNPGRIDEITGGVIDGVTITNTLLLVAAVLIQFALVVEVATLNLPDWACWIVNSLAVALILAFVIEGGLL